MINSVKMGIYKIENLQNGKVYVGSSKNIKSRWRQHINSLNKNKHHSAHLQYSWNKYGEEAFIFSIIEEVENENQLFEREQFHIDSLTSSDENYGYNMQGVVGEVNKNRNDTFKYKKLNDLLLKEEVMYSFDFEENRPIAPFSMSKLNENDDVFDCLIKTIFSFYHCELIEMDNIIEVTLFTKTNHINMNNFQGIEYLNLVDLLEGNYFEMIRLYNSRYGYSIDIFRDKILNFEFDYDEIKKSCNLNVQTQFGVSSFILSYQKQATPFFN